MDVRKYKDLIYEIIGSAGEVDIVSPYFVVEISGANLAVFFLFDTFPFPEIEFFPTFESEAVAAVVLGGNVHSHHGGFDEDGSRAAHRIVEVGVALPASKLDHACGKDFIEGGNTDGLAVAALMQGVA